MTGDIVINPKVTVDLAKYGAEGQIVLEPLNFRRRKELQNNMGKTTHISSLKDEDIEMKSQDFGDLSVYRVMAYITSAPFRYDTLQGFYNFMDRLDRQRLGSADELFADLETEIKGLKGNNASPLANLPTSETPTSVPDS